MRMSRFVGKTTKETPKDAQTASHIFLLRGGYIRQVSTGIFSLLPLGKRVAQKIEKIIREEMNGIDGQEVLMPVVLPRELWNESGRYDSVGLELLRFKDRNNKEMLLGMTHEEAVVHLARTEVSSYKQLPFMLYQIQTKYRDEARPRAGLIRVREFTMKDAYSFHSSLECLKSYYDRAHEAYERIFRRIGMTQVVSIESDTGMMGGSASHEFMALADCGEDTIFMSPDGKYKANREIARSALQFKKEAPKPLTKVHTPDAKTIEEVADFLKVSPSDTGKVVFYSCASGKLYLVVIRGDIEVNETKLRNVLKISELRFATDDQICAIGAVPGFASPMNLDITRVQIIFDRSARETSNLVVGANELDHHCLNFNFDRDLGDAGTKIMVADIATVKEGDPCPITGQPLVMKRGIEVGNIFQLGTKYSKAMNCTFLDDKGKSHPMIMGCYGIGIGRAAAAVIEQSHDQYGPIWPVSIAPFTAQICAINLQDSAVKESAEYLYRTFQEAGIDVLYDDRNEKPGSAFSDADLIGAPYRFIVSSKTVAQDMVEFRTRSSKESILISPDAAVSKITSFER